MDFLPPRAYTFNMNKHKVIALIALLIAASMLYADKAYLYTNTEINSRTASGALYKDDAYNAASNDFKLNSVVEITDIETDKTVVVMINDTLPKTVEGRTIAVTPIAAEELGILDKGLAEVSIRLIRGEVLEADAASVDVESGWYRYDLGLFESDKEAYKVYSRLIRNEMKPEISIEEGKIRIAIPFVREFEREEAEIAIALSGVANPVASKTHSPFN